jgi:hypothetical protein
MTGSISAKVAWHSGHRTHLHNRRFLVQILARVKSFGSFNIAMLQYIVIVFPRKINAQLSEKVVLHFYVDFENAEIN